jgi:uncharacterized protein YjbJ (UPF0337 family)
MRNRNEVGGRTRKAIGIVKERLGRLTGSRRLQEDGAAQRTAGGFQAGVGKVTRKVDEALGDADDDIKRL